MDITGCVPLEGGDLLGSPANQFLWRRLRSPHDGLRPLHPELQPALPYGHQGDRDRDGGRQGPILRLHVSLRRACGLNASRIHSVASPRLHSGETPILHVPGIRDPRQLEELVEQEKSRYISEPAASIAPARRPKSGSRRGGHSLRLARLLTHSPAHICCRSPVADA